MSIGKILGSMSPMYGAVTGRGVFGDIQKALGPAAGLAYQAGKAKRDADASEQARSEWYKKNGFKPDGSFKKGGKVKKMAKGGSTASKRADGCAKKGKTKGRFV